MLGKYLDRTRERAPLVHCITNYVTMNDVANMILAVGASPVMAEVLEDALEMTELASGLYLNMGSVQDREVMLAVGKRAASLGHPVVLDPVGAGAGNTRSQLARRMMDQVPLACLRGNASEMRALILGEGKTQGVDVAPGDEVSEEELDWWVTHLHGLAKAYRCVAAVTGPIDLLADGSRCVIIRNGREEMTRVTGTGCQLTGLITAMIAASPEEPLEAAAAAVCAMGLAGEIGFSHLADYEGNASYRNRMIDAIYHLDGKTLDKEGRYEIR